MCLIQTIEELSRSKRLNKKELFLPHLKSWDACLFQPSDHTFETTALGLQPASSWSGIYTISSPGSRSLDSEWNYTSDLMGL